MIEFTSKSGTVVFHFEWQLVVPLFGFFALLSLPFIIAPEHTLLAGVWTLISVILGWFLGRLFAYYGLLIMTFLTLIIAFYIMPFVDPFCQIAPAAKYLCAGVTAMWWTVWIVVFGFISALSGSSVAVKKSGPK